MNAVLSEKPHAAYVERLRRRLASPTIDVHDARDGVLDCFVATYQEGLAAGMQGVVGIDARPEQVARVAAGLFRKRLASHGASFEEPTVDALARVKAEVDEELHFEKLPVEIQATHDRVCELLLAKAEGSLPHAGDHSAVVGPRSGPATVLLPSVSRATDSTQPTKASTSATGTLREAVARLLEDLAERARAGRATAEVLGRLTAVRTLLETIHELETE